MSWRRKPRSAGAAAGAAELAALLREQEREVSLIRELSATVTAPPELRARLAAERQRERRRPRRQVLATAVAAAAVLALVLLLALPESEGGPTVAEAATIAQRGATSPAPAPAPRRPKLLAADVGGVAFPAWERAFGWRTAGQRADNLDGRRTATVYYAKDGRRIGYTIVDGAPLPALRAATSVRRAGTVLGTFHTGGRVVVTWLRGGRTCVLSGSGVPRRTLLKLAAWRGGGAVAF
jgi:hypothetical protein